MKQYEINGKDRVTPVHCGTCCSGATKEIKDKDGNVIHTVKMFDNHIRTHKYANSTAEHICGVCNTKYKMELTDAPRLMDENCSSCPHNGPCCQLKDEEIICAGNIDKFIKTMEVSTMNEELIQDKDQFQATGICKKHNWIEGRIKTFEGIFVVKNCRVCGTAIADYKGESIMGDITAVTRFVINKGIAKEKITISKIQTDDSIFSSVPLFEVNDNLNSIFTMKVEAVADKIKPVLEDTFNFL